MFASLHDKMLNKKETVPFGATEMRYLFFVESDN
jgi:hypothetical protein